MFRKMVALFTAAVLLAFSASGCSSEKAAQSGSGGIATEEKKLGIVTTLFPQYDFARQIAGDKAEIIMLMPAGVESHNYEPTPEDIIKINGSDLFIYTGQYMEPWAQSIIDGITIKEVYILDASANIQLDKAEEHEHEEADGHEEEHEHEFDPHVWTDPQNAKIMVDNIAAALCRIDPGNKDYYDKNAADYKAKLDELDREFREIVQNGSRKEIIFGGRFAFHYFTKRYGLQYESAYDTCSTEAEPSVKVVAELINKIKEEKIPVIYYEELTTPKVAQSISSETGAKMLLLHSCHNVSKEEFDSGATYLSLMKQNAKNLKEGLE